jgi:hypothetical protein
MAGHLVIPPVDLRVFVDRMKPVVDVTRQWVEFIKNAAGDGPDAYLSPWFDLSYHLGHALEDNFAQTRDRLLRSLGAGEALAQVSPPQSPRTALAVVDLGVR